MYTYKNKVYTFCIQVSMYCVYKMVINSPEIKSRPKNRLLRTELKEKKSKYEKYKV